MADEAKQMVDDDPALVLDPNSDLYALHQIFNSSGASRRVFSEVHFYRPKDPHLTIGMGHWIEGNIATLFSRLRADGQLWQEVAARWASELSDGQWTQFRQETDVDVRGAAGLSEGLDRVVCADDPKQTHVEDRLIPWASKVGEDFNSGTHWFTKGWKSVSRLKPVAVAQVRYWAEGVLDRGVADAAARGIYTRGGVATVISARSSGIGSTMFGAGAREATAADGTLVRRWSLAEVPSAARPDADGVSEEELLQDWRSVVAWQYYAISKGKVRGRMKTIWKTYYRRSWGVLDDSTLSDATDVPQHSGEPMDARPFDFSVVFRS